MALLPYSGSNGNLVDAGRIGVLRAMNLGGQVIYVSGLTEEFSDGFPSSPSLKIAIPNSFRFRWVVRTGVHTIRVSAKQVVNQEPRPSIIVRANPSIGIPNDITAFAASGTGWVTAGPITVTPTDNGAVYVDLVNNYAGMSQAPAYFDHIITT